MKKIKLGTKDIYTVVDDQDFELASKYPWYASIRKKDGYIRVVCKKQVNNVKFHYILSRVIMNPPKGLMVDHINGDTLDNRRQNLRLATHQQNCQNRKKASKVNNYKGVYLCKRSYKLNKPWQALTDYHKKKVHIGMFATEIEAAKAYDERAKDLFGEFARLNFPNQ